MRSLLAIARPLGRLRVPGRRSVVLVGVLLTVVTAASVGLGQVRTDTSPASFLPSGDKTLEDMRQVARSFGGDPIVVLAKSPQPRQLLSPEQLPRLVRLEGRLAKLPDVAVVYGPGTVLNQLAISSQNLLARLSGRRDAIGVSAASDAREQGASAKEAKAAAAAAVRTFDRRYGSLLVRGLPAGLPTLHNPGFVNAVIFDKGGVPHSQWRFVVPAPDAVAILVRPRENLGQAGTERLVDGVRTTVREAGLRTTHVDVTGAPAVTAGLSEQVRKEMPLLGGLAVGVIGLSYFLVPWQRRRRHRLLPLAATLCSTALVLAGFGWLDLPLSLGVVAFLPILVGIGSDFPAYLVHGANLRRVLVASLASAAGFASLAISPLPFVRELGLALAAGVLLAVGVALLFRRYLVSHPPDHEQQEPPATSLLSPVRRAGLLLIAGGVALSGWVALPWLDIESRVDQLAAGLPAVEDARHAERVLGSSGEVRVVLRGPDVLTPKALAWMRKAQDKVVVAYGSKLRPIVSMPDLLKFLGPSPTPQQISAGARLVPSYLTHSVASADSHQAVVSFGLELQDLSAQQRLLHGLREAMPPPPPGFRVEVVGLPVAAARGYELIGADRYLTNGLGIALAGLVLAAGLRRRSDAMRAILAATFATGWGLAGAWLLGISLTPLTIALGSLTTVTACEFTVLLASDRQAGRRRLRRTVMVAALAASLGYATLAASGLSIIREFGVLLAATVVLSLLAAHLVVRLLPAHRPVPAPPHPARAFTPSSAEVTI